MTLIVEDGTYVPTANSYATVTEANDYLRARARSAAWDAYTPAQKEGYLIDATAYLDANVQWKGIQSDPDQFLGWPRSGIEDRYGYPVSNTVVPPRVKWAVIEIAAQGSLTVTASRLKQSVTVGPISTTYAAGSDPAQGVSKYKLALSMLSGLVESVAGGSTIRLVRG